MSYLLLDHAKRERRIARAVDAIGILSPEPQPLAFIGYSGAIIVPEIARRLCRPVIALRKTNDGSHGSEVECHHDDMYYCAAESWIFCDDFIDTGKTLRTATDMIKAEGKELAGVMLFNDDFSLGYRRNNLFQSSTHTRLPYWLANSRHMTYIPAYDNEEREIAE